MEENAKLINTHHLLLEHLLEHSPAALPPGAPEGTPPSVNVQFTLRMGMSSVGNVRRGPIPGMYTAVCAQRDQRGALIGMAELYFPGDDLVLIVRPLEEAAPSIIAASPGDLPPSVRVRGR